MDLDDARNAVEREVQRIDDLVPASPEVGNAVLPDRSRLTHWAGPLFALLSLLLIPWTIYLAIALPDREQSAHYDVAWAGFDCMLILALAGTAYTTLRRSSRTIAVAAVTGTMLMIDAWFDVLTAPTRGEAAISVVMALLIELPLAGLCFWLSGHAGQLNTERLRLLLRRNRP